MEHGKNALKAEGRPVLKILVACEESQAVCLAFRELGCFAIA